MQQPTAQAIGNQPRSQLCDTDLCTDREPSALKDIIEIVAIF